MANNLFKKILFLLLASLGLLLGSCSSRKDLDEDGVPVKLIAAVTPGEDPEQTLQKMEPIRLYLEKKLGIDITFIKATDYTAVIEAVRAKKVHVAFMSPFSFVLASEKIKLRPLVSLGSNGQPRMYRSILMTQSKSSIASMEDVKMKAKQLSLAFTDPASTSGHLVPRAYLTSIGLNPDNAFRQTLFASSHVASIMTVKSGKADLGCTFLDTYNRVVANGLLKPEEIRILWTSEPIVSGPVVIREDISQDFAEKLKNALLSIPKEDPEAWAVYKSATFAKDTTFVYVETQDSLFNGLRKIASGIKELKTLDH